MNVPHCTLNTTFLCPICKSSTQEYDITGVCNTCYTTKRKTVDAFYLKFKPKPPDGSKARINNLNFLRIRDRCQNAD